MGMPYITQYMVKIEDLTGIPEKRRNQAVRCLDELLTFRDDQGRISPVITGYNWYSTFTKSDRMITFSHIHETGNYLQDMLRDLKVLGYDTQTVLKCIREKSGAFLWDLYFKIRTNGGKVLPGLKIKDGRIGQYLHLEHFTRPLGEYPQFMEADGHLIGEDEGWELNLSFNNKQELMKLVTIFLQKSGTRLFDEEGNEIIETEEQKSRRNPWTDAYQTPVLLLGEIALQYANELPHFIPANKFSLIMNSNEISFVIHKNLGRLKNSPHYKRLLELGFKEEGCLGNKPFVADYIDKER